MNSINRAPFPVASIQATRVASDKPRADSAAEHRPGSPSVSPVSPRDSRLLEVSREFESVFLQQLFRQMKATIPRSNLVQASFGRAVFEGWQDQMLAGEMSKSGGIGLAEMLYRQLSGAKPRVKHDR